MESLCETFSWKPEDVENMDVFYINAFMNILRGRKEGMDAKNLKK